MFEIIEQEVMRMWDTHSDLSEIMEYICEADEIDQDEVSNLLLGVISMMSIRLEGLMRTMDIADTYYEAVLKDE